MLIALALQMATISITQQVDPMTDKTVAIASLDNGSDKISVVCNAAKPEIFVTLNTKTFLSTSDDGQIEYRFDHQKPDRDGWVQSGHRAQLGGIGAGAFVLRMLRASHLLLQLDDAVEGAARTTFDWSGSEAKLRAAVVTVADACGKTRLAKEIRASAAKQEGS